MVEIWVDNSKVKANNGESVLSAIRGEEFVDHGALSEGEVCKQAYKCCQNDIAVHH